MDSCHLLLLFPLSSLRCDFDTKATGSPFAGDGSREGSVEEEESPRKRRRKVDILAWRSHGERWEKQPRPSLTIMRAGLSNGNSWLFRRASPVKGFLQYLPYLKVQYLFRFTGFRETEGLH